MVRLDQDFYGSMSPLAIFGYFFGFLFETFLSRLFTTFLSISSKFSFAPFFGLQKEQEREREKSWFALQKINVCVCVCGICSKLVPEVVCFCFRQPPHNQPRDQFRRDLLSLLAFLHLRFSFLHVYKVYLSSLYIGVIVHVQQVEFLVKQKIQNLKKNSKLSFLKSIAMFGVMISCPKVFVRLLLFYRLKHVHALTNVTTETRCKYKQKTHTHGNPCKFEHVGKLFYKLFYRKFNCLGCVCVCARGSSWLKYQTS